MILASKHKTQLHVSIIDDIFSKVINYFMLLSKREDHSSGIMLHVESIEIFRV